MRQSTIAFLLGACLVHMAATPALSADAAAGREILEHNCGRCHGVVAGSKSPLEPAPNLFAVLGSYPYERLDIELAEGIGSRHTSMPQIQFSDEQIEAIYKFLHGREPDAELRAPQ